MLISFSHWTQKNWNATLTHSSICGIEANFYLQTRVFYLQARVGCIWILKKPSFSLRGKTGASSRIGFKFRARGSVPVLLSSMSVPCIVNVIRGIFVAAESLNRRLHYQTGEFSFQAL